MLQIIAIWERIIEYKKAAVKVRGIYRKLLNANIKNEHNAAPTKEL